MSQDLQTHKAQLPLAFSAWIITLLVSFYFFDANFHDFINESYQILTSGDREKIRNWVEGIGFWGPLAIIAGMTVQMFLVVIPSVILMVVSILAYGSFWGILIILAAIAVASTVGYVIGKVLSPMTVEKMVGKKKKEKLTFYVDNYGFWVVAIVRLSPAFSNDAISFVAGLLKMRFVSFISATLAGTLPLAALLAYFGKKSERLETGLIVVSALSLLSLIGYIYFDRKKRGSSS